MNMYELRPGNYVNRRFNGGKILKEYTIEMLDLYYLSREYSKNFKPIRVSKKWMQRLNFNEYIKRNGRYYYNDLPLNYVHQLQNIHFILTGKKLK